MKADVVVVGAGLAGLVATAELAAAGRSVILVEQEPAQSLGGQAFWSFGGLFLVGSPEQRRMGIRDSPELAWQDWQDNAGFDRAEDEWPRRWAKAYVDWAAGGKRAWLREKGIKLFPIVGWAERAGNSVPRFHITWGTGPGVLEPFIAAAVSSGRVRILFRHRVDALVKTGGTVTGAAGRVLAPSDVARGEASSREETGDFTIEAQAVVVTSGGIGGNHDLVRENWPASLGTPPAHLISGVPAHVDGRMLGIATAAGGSVINPDRMWHYVEGIQNWDPIWDRHGIRILPGPSSLWLDALGRRLPAPLYPGFDTLGALAHLRTTGHDHSWFVLTQRIIEKEFALSGSEQNPDLTGRSVRRVLGRVRGGAPAPVEAFKHNGADFVVAGDLDELVEGMNALTPAPLLDPVAIRRTVEGRDRELDNAFGKDLQLAAIRGLRAYRGDRLMRTAAPHRLLDPAAGPLIAVRLHVLTRKSLGGLHTDLDGRVLDAAGAPVPGLYAAGEAAGFGGGGMHGYRALEGTFLGGCLFSGRQAARGVNAQL
ncbi:FAD-binding dehydrogenase [Paractinoplanes abujensis]|uniref:Putative oxidoreductase n=1 Tax=Paractinoplanes abujensis TaxID=882441 RepID=A0A7W7G272_9ACTN|nr:FAD-binding dehydrogenase [Actinoplanes abujensis]MBB4691376.1 putative oxidoreductase [Actinoplanes abujensis]GID17210.1 FAD-binding dehydrogenase [Actinoplanes abujensis]